MKKQIFVLFILAIACAFSISAVMAEDLETYDFDAKFTMQMEKGLNFTETPMDDGQGYFTDVNNAWGVMYIESPKIREDNIDEFYKGFEEKGYKTIGTDGNVRIYEKGDMYYATTYKDGIMVVSLNTDKDKVENAIKTVKFS